MAITTTSHFSWTTDNTVGTTGYTVRYRLTGSMIWFEYNTSGTTAAIPGLAIDRIYDFQVVNINNNGNPASAISQGINITDPGPIFSPTNSAIGYSFSNLSVDITEYIATIALSSTPTVVISTHVLPITDNITDTFTGLNNLTQYQVSIQPVAGPFYNTFTYLVTTTELSTCPIPLTVVSLLTT